MFEIHCPTCARPGKASTDQGELQVLAGTHNTMLHRGHPVAVIRRASARKAA
jgi:hypothetical protein